jgi:hypothetical protein
VRDDWEVGDVGDTDSREDGEESVGEGVRDWDLMRDSSVVTLSSTAKIVLCAASCCT